MSLADYLVPINNSNILCFNCQKACGKCSWSSRFEPVPGWTAKKRMLKVGHGREGKRFVETYHITACPEHVPDKPRKSEPYEVTDEQWAVMRGRWKRTGDF